MERVRGMDSVGIVGKWATQGVSVPSGENYREAT